MFTGKLEIWVEQLDGSETYHVTRNTLTDEFKTFAARKVAGDATESRTLTAAGWRFVHHAVGGGAVPARAAGDLAVDGVVTFPGGSSVQVAANITYDEDTNLATRKFALDFGTERWAYITGSEWGDVPPTVARAGTSVRYRWTISTATTTITNRTDGIRNTTHDLTVQSDANIGALIVGVMRGNTAFPRTLGARVYRWTGNLPTDFNDETDPYPTEQVGSPLVSGAVSRVGLVLTWDFAIPEWGLQNGQPLSLDVVVLVDWGGNNLAVFGWARNAEGSGTQPLPVTMTFT